MSPRKKIIIKLADPSLSIKNLDKKDAASDMERTVDFRGKKEGYGEKSF